MDVLARTRKEVVSLGLVAIAVLTLCWLGVRFLAAHEPGATRLVNEDADWLLMSGNAADLEAVADAIQVEFGDHPERLGTTRLGRPGLVPIDRLPSKFRGLGGYFKSSLEVVLETETPAHAARLVLMWGNGRHQVVVYGSAPTFKPRGFAVREVTSRVHVVANES